MIKKGETMVITYEFYEKDTWVDFLAYSDENFTFVFYRNKLIMGKYPSGTFCCFKYWNSKIHCDQPALLDRRTGKLELPKNHNCGLEYFQKIVDMAKIMISKYLILL